MKIQRHARWAAAVSAIALWSTGAIALDYPEAPTKPVVNIYHGVAVTDPYQWLEQGGAAEVKDWVAAENRLSRQWLDAVPGRALLRERIDRLMKSNSNAYFDLIERGGQVFAMKSQPPKQQPLLVLLKSVDSTTEERVVLDPNTLSDHGAITIDFYEPSLDGRKVAVSLSANGSEDGTLHVYDVATGKALPDEVPRVAYPTGGGSVAWNADGSGFFYTRYPAPGERPDADVHFFQQVWFHRLGTPAAKDRYEAGRDFPRIAETVLETARDGAATTALVANGDGGDYALYLRQGSRWHKLADFADGIKQARFGNDGWLYLLSRKGAPKGRILRVSMKQPQLAKAEVVLPESDGTVEAFQVADGQLFVSELLGGPSRLRAVNLQSGKVDEISLPDVSGVSGLVRIGHGQVLARVMSYVAPPAWYHVAVGQAPRKSALAVTSAADYGDTEVLREFATSKDGTKVPLTIVRRKGTALDGSNPTILHGYGGYGVSMTPYFSASRRVWLEHGGVLVVANLRGGGEYGEAWHLAGNLTRKQTVFDDFIASAEYLVQRGYTQPARLAIQGGSNGGLLMGAALTQRPELFRAVDSSVGIYDMLRVELDPNGAFNVTEFGSVKDKAQFEALYAYSPYHRVKDGTAYPAVLMVTGDNDGRVNPAHSRKMVARLQAADPKGRPILLRTSSASGHGIGTALSEAIEQATDEYAFLFHELGVSVTAP
ncbi:prolyl oligopeptidase family serine peptidase [Ideonella sp. BN130291]|uniref:prolyl oligopeptidase family serine peptidase n=1 Tax=Ideonella sp. BN130291 TaxID=3112940 RepID=UPI002E25F21C|nr:prolyl oligopeptidase family serine peptidase [Ideonella sp. BN130291]